MVKVATDPMESGHLTYGELVRLELDGKNKAQAGYDAILWKIRTGYAVVLYGSLSLSVTLFDKQSISVSEWKGFFIFSLIVVGFSAFAGFLDYSFLKSKLRVVRDTNELMDFALRMVLDEKLVYSELHDLQDLLHNSAESTKEIDWDRWSARAPLAYLYGGTAAVGVLIVFLAFLVP